MLNLRAILGGSRHSHQAYSVNALPLGKVSVRDADYYARHTATPQGTVWTLDNGGARGVPFVWGLTMPTDGLPPPTFQPVQNRGGARGGVITQNTIYNLQDLIDLGVL